MKNRAFFLCVLSVALVMFAESAWPQTYTVLYNFPLLDGDPQDPASDLPLTQAQDGNLYGTSQFGGAVVKGAQRGAVFQVTPSGQVTVIHSFDDIHGQQPTSGLTLGTDGVLYGTTFDGGISGLNRGGTLFKIRTDGTFTLFHRFNNQTDGAGPTYLVQGRDGNFYGTTIGEIGTPTGMGNVFKITPGGKLTILYSFDGIPPDGANPKGIVLGKDGAFYGTTIAGGTDSSCHGGCGIAYKITPNGTFTALHSFTKSECQSANALIQGSDGNLYGTCFLGGTLNMGTIYQLSPAGALKLLYTFGNDGTGAGKPRVGLTEGTDGKFYGVAFSDPFVHDGIVFQIDSSGNFTVLHAFMGSDGNGPGTPLAQHTSGVFYGETVLGGTGLAGCFECGVLFSLDTGLKPFAHLVNCAGKVGETIQILGQGFTGTTSVTFNGAAASFSVGSDTLLTATVPPNATNGPVKVVSASQTLQSDRKFRVVP